MASLNRGVSFRRQGSSGMSWTDTWSFNEEGVLVRTLKEEHLQQRLAGSSLSRIHDLQDDDDDAHNDDGAVDDADETLAQKPSSSSFHTCPPSSTLERSKSVGSTHVLHHKKPSPRVFKWIKKAFHKMKK